MITDNEAQAILGQMKNSGLSLLEIERQLGVNRGLIHRALKGIHSPRVRHALNLPPLLVLAQPCRTCGEVHTLKHCNKKRSTRRRAHGKDVPPDYTDEMATMYRLMHLAYSKAADAQIRGLFNGEVSTPVDSL